MLIRPTEPVFPSTDTDTRDLMETLQRLMDAVRNGADSHLTTQMLQRAMSASQYTAQRVQELKKDIAILERDSVTDPLTGALNRRGFENELRHALAEGRRYGEHGALLFLDLDGFKQINDTLGHSAGDALLRKFATILVNNVRDTDSVGRLGGDEFAVLMGRTSIKNAKTRAESLEWVINTTAFEWNGQPVSVQASLGTNYFGPDDDGAGIIGRADEDMYRRKQERRKSPRPNYRAESIAIHIPPMAQEC